MRHRLSVMAALAASFLTAAAFGEQVDNPVYLTWSKCKPGSSITYTQTTEMSIMAGMKTESTVTQKLVEVKPEELTLETTTKISVGGQEQAPMTSKTTIAAKVEKGQEYLPPNAAASNVQIKDVKEGKDTIEFKGKKVEAATREYTVTMDMPARGGAGGGTITMHVKTWNSPDVPGGLIRNEQSGTMGTMGTMKSALNLTDYAVEK